MSGIRVKMMGSNAAGQFVRDIFYTIGAKIELDHLLRKSFPHKQNLSDKSKYSFFPLPISSATRDPTRNFICHHSEESEPHDDNFWTEFGHTLLPQALLLESSMSPCTIRLQSRWLCFCKANRRIRSSILLLLSGDDCRSNHRFECDVKRMQTGCRSSRVHLEWYHKID